MWRNSSFVVIVWGIVFGGTTIGCRKGGEPSVGSALQSMDNSRSLKDGVTAKYVGMLTDSGWGKQSAYAVVNLNAEWFAIQADENPAGLEFQLRLLSDLGRHPDLDRFLTEHPETAGLLATVDDPQLIADSLRDATDSYQRVAGLYVQHAAPTDARDIARALKADFDLICTMHARGLLGSEVIFIFDRDAAGANEYEAWLRDAILSRLKASDDEFASFLHLVLHHGPALRNRLQNDEEFRRRFRNELWPRFARAVDGEHGMFELYLDDERIWDLVGLDNGEELLKRCGLLPIDLLYGYLEIGHPPYPKVLHDKIVQLLLRREDRTIQALMKFRSEPLFHKFIAREMSSNTLSAALTQLFNSGTNYPARLSLYERLDDKALSDEVGPPAAGVVTWVPFYYTIYEVPKKLLQGREPSGMDLFSAAVDPAFLVVDLFTAGGSYAGRKALLVGGKEAVEKATQKFTEKGAEKALVTTLRDTGLKLACKQIGKDVAEKMGEKELANWTITGILSEVQQAVRTTIGKATTFEITKPVQFMFQFSRAGRESWKRFTGMEARLFMRGDAKIYVRLNHLAGAVVGSRSAAFIERTAQDLALGTAFESEPGQDVAHEGIKRVVSAKDQLLAWQHNVSAWWLLNASRNTVQSGWEKGSTQKNIQ